MFSHCRCFVTALQVQCSEMWQDGALKMQCSVVQCSEVNREINMMMTGRVNTVGEASSYTSVPWYHIEENQNVCDECGKACKSAGFLKKHKEEKHCGESEEDIKKKFETLCGEDPKFEQWKSLVEAAAKLGSTLGTKLLM